jgi:hypothetical protein
MTDERYVFINCPFDRAYRPLLRALLFVVADCGFEVRSALEVEDSGERVELDPSSNLPRFNMPLELGLFLGAKAYGDTNQHSKRALILDAEPYRYQKFCSDIAGQDIRAHHNKASVVIEVVRNWLSTTPAASGTVIPSGSLIAKRYRDFRAGLPSACARLRLNPRRLTFVDDVALVNSWLKEYPWTPNA